MRPRESSRPAYAMVWVIMTIAVVAALIAAAAPTIAVVHERARAARTADQLRSIAEAVDAFGTKVGNYPGNISELTNPLSTSDKNSCRGAMTSTNVAQWVEDAPYVSFYTAVGGNWTELGRIRDSIPVRPNPANHTPIYAEIPGVSSADAAMLDNVVDNGSGDTVTYHAPVNDTTTVRYRLLSSGKVRNDRC
ncbi:MAG TPA: hypothetical protein VIP11_25190 [Gemmatimonadaceae bacterium]